MQIALSRTSLGRSGGTSRRRNASYVRQVLQNGRARAGIAKRGGRLGFPTKALQIGEKALRAAFHRISWRVLDMERLNDAVLHKHRIALRADAQAAGCPVHFKPDRPPPKAQSGPAGAADIASSSNAPRLQCRCPRKALSWVAGGSEAGTAPLFGVIPFRNLKRSLSVERTRVVFSAMMDL